ncbi:HelD family protein [Rhizohabitans arisaemae]|uniref:HelD family protein n=1 Tax=Rhizohabitans arisaemae TaxID=2720610 RepID=UPI0024B03FE1|nr:ATP-binding domain-containing protein [Rhizohabitans arisaemae]
MSRLYARLDALRARTSAQLEEVLRQGASGTHQARSERDSFAGMYSQRLARLWAVENALCFGRLDSAAGERLYIGRIGLSDDEQDRLLIDWRAPVAQPFYRATPAVPLGLVRRRHLRSKGRRVVGVDDDLFDLDALSDSDRDTLNGEAALLASLAESRTGRMRDIVATIQGEQDRIIRSDLAGVLVVEGGPGTGKTVVALHRAAYLLYTHRERLERRGVLIVGPNPVFMRYIDQVLPSLGETDVLLSTVGGLYPGVDAKAEDPPAAAAIKGDARMAEVIAKAVLDRQRLPGAPVEVRIAGDTLRLDRQTCEGARNRARRSRKPYNEARKIFIREVLGALTRQAARRIGRGALSEADLADLREELREEPEVRVTLNRLWPYLTPQQLLVGLFTSAERLAEAAPKLSKAERKALLREPPKAGREWWTVSDVPLLDEAAELLGEIDAGVLKAAARQAEEDRERLTYAREVLSVLGMDDIMDASLLAERQRGDDAYLTTAERAAGDRTWAFGHVIVDEAQELSPMAWRMLARRCPSRSMTVVGDMAQTGSAAGSRSWAEALDPYAAGRWRRERLSVNYRTPTPIMDVAADVLTHIDPGAEPPRSVREGDSLPWARRLDGHGDLAGVVAAELAAVGDGRLAVLVPADLLGPVEALVAEAVPSSTAEAPAAVLDAPVAVLTVGQAKGLEFDAVVVVEPERIAGESPRGMSDLYVALTRATRRLGVVHTGTLPAALARLEPLGR